MVDEGGVQFGQQGVLRFRLAGVGDPLVGPGTTEDCGKSQDSPQAGANFA
jgi:hypothetical protein